MFEHLADHADRAEQLHFRCGHLPRIGRLLVIVPEQMEEAVGEQSRELLTQRAPAVLRLSSRRVERDHHVAERARRQIEAEGQHIRRLVLLTPRLIELPNARVGGHHDRELAPKLQRFNETPSEPAKLPHGVGAFGVFGADLDQLGG